MRASASSVTVLSSAMIVPKGLGYAVSSAQLAAVHICTVAHTICEPVTVCVNPKRMIEGENAP